MEKSKSLHVTRVKPYKCDLCASARTVYVSYRDPTRPGEFIKPRPGVSYELPLYEGSACDLHVSQVTISVLKKAELWPVSYNEVTGVKSAD